MKNHLFRIGLGIGLFGFLAFWGSGSLAQAQDTTGVTIEPPLIQEHVNSDQVLERSLRIRNIDNSERTFSLYIRNISSVDDQGQPTFVDENTPADYGLASWIKLSKDTVTIPANDFIEVPFTINVPKDVSPGGHFGGIFVSLGPTKIRQTGSGVGYEVGSIISLSVSGDVVDDVQIREFRTDKEVYSDANVKFTTLVENLGNTLAQPRGPIDIVNMFGKKVATLRMNNDAAGVFPKTKRTFETTWQSEDLAFGRYHAVMSLLYGDTTQHTVSDVVSFWVLPLNIIAPAVIGLLALVLIVFFGLRWYVRRRLKALGYEAGAATAEMPNTRLPFSYLLFATLAIIVVCLVLLGLLFFLFGS